MSEGILINRVEFKINKKKFDEKYVVLEANYEHYIPRKEAVELLAKYSFVRAIRYDFKPGVFHVLCFKDPHIQEAIELVSKQTLKENPVRIVPFDTLGADIQIELLNIGLGYADPDSEDGRHYSNMEGALYVHTPSKVKKDHIEALNIKYRTSRDLEQFGNVSVDFKATSFYDWDLHPRMIFKRKRPEDYVKYVKTDQGNMKVLRGEPEKGEKAYIHHGYLKNKASIPFYDVGSVAAMDNTKMGMLASSHRDLRYVYGDIIEEFGFVRVDTFDDMHVRMKGGKDGFEDHLKELVSGRTFRIHDYLNNAESKQVVEGFITDVKELYGIDIETEDGLDPSVLNIAVVQKRRNDENHGIYTDMVVQHLAVESVGNLYTGNRPKGIGSRKSTVATTLINAIIKEDVQKGKQSFLGWMRKCAVSEPDDRDWYYVDRVRIENPNPETRMKAAFSPKMAVMRMSADGSTDYRLYEYNELTEDWMRRAYSCFRDPNIRGVVSDGKSIYCFRDADVVMIPEVEKTRQILQNNPVKSNGKKTTEGVRGSEEREEQLKACTDIRAGTDECGNLLYFVGIRGEGMNTRIHWAANLHMVELLSDSEPLPKYLLELMLAPFVRFNRMTVIPYQFKYLHEYERMNGLEEYIPESNEDNGGGETMKQMSLFDYFQEPEVESD